MTALGRTGTGISMAVTTPTMTGRRTGASTFVSLFLLVSAMRRLVLFAGSSGGGSRNAGWRMRLRRYGHGGRHRCPLLVSCSSGSSWRSRSTSGGS